MKDFWWWNLGKIPPCRGTPRGGREAKVARRTQPEEQPIVQASNPTAPITHADLTVMEQRYQNMLREALAPFQAAQQTLTFLV